MYDLHQDAPPSNLRASLVKLNFAVEWLAVLIRILEVCGSILGIKTNYSYNHIFSFL
jgi:hypothetical protein